jgi:hypothetical protein
MSKSGVIAGAMVSRLGIGSILSAAIDGLSGIVAGPFGIAIGGIVGALAGVAAGVIIGLIANTINNNNLL